MRVRDSYGIVPESSGICLLQKVLKGSAVLLQYSLLVPVLFSTLGSRKSEVRSQKSEVRSRKARAKGLGSERACGLENTEGGLVRAKGLRSERACGLENTEQGLVRARGLGSERACGLENTVEGWVGQRGWAPSVRIYWKTQ